MHPAVPQLNIFKVHAGNDATQQESNESLASAAAAASSKSARGPGGPHSARGTTGIASVALSGRGWDSQTARTRSYAASAGTFSSSDRKLLPLERGDAVCIYDKDGRLLVAGQDENGRQALVPDTANTAVTHVRARLEIIQAEQQEEYIGFRSAYADQLLLQCTKGPDARLHFVSGNMGVRESWKIEDQKPRTAWNRITVTLSNRYLPGAVFRGELQRIGRYEHHGGNKTARSIRIPEEVSASAEMSGEKEAMKRVKNLMEIRHLNGLRQEAEKRNEIEGRLQELQQSFGTLRDHHQIEVDSIRGDAFQLTVVIQQIKDELEGTQDRAGFLQETVDVQAGLLEQLRHESAHKLLLRQTFVDWRQQTAVSQFNQVRAMAHREHLALRWQRQLFTFWKAISTDREAFIRDHLQAVGKRQLARAFCSWRSAAKESVAVGQQACEIMQDRRLQLCFQSWHSHTAQLQQGRDASDQLFSGKQAALKSHALLAWSDSLSTAKAAEQTAAQLGILAKAKLQRQRKLSAFTTLAEAAAAAQQAREAADVLAARRKLQLQARMLLRWRLGAMQLLEARETLETKAATRLSLLRQTQMLAAWRNAAHLQALLQAMLKHAVATLQARSLRLAFQSWHQRAQYNAHLERAEKQVTAKVPVRQVKAAFGSWKDFTAALAASRLQAKAMVHNKDLALQKEALDGWHMRAEQLKIKSTLVDQALKASAGKLAQGKVRRVLQHWKAHVQGTADARVKLQQAIAKACSPATAQVWAAWRAGAVRSEWCADVISSRHRRLQLSGALQAWKASVQQRKQAAVILAGVADHVHVRNSSSLLSGVAYAAQPDAARLLLTLKTWRAWFRDRKRQQHLVEELQQRRKMRLLMSAFASWQSDAVLGQELKARADGLAELQQLRRLQHALSKWVQAVADRKKLQGRLTRCLHAKRLARMYLNQQWWNEFEHNFEEALDDVHSQPASERRYDPRLSARHQEGIAALHPPMSNVKEGELEGQEDSSSESLDSESDEDTSVAASLSGICSHADSNGHHSAAALPLKDSNTAGHVSPHVSPRATPGNELASSTPASPGTTRPYTDARSNFTARTSSTVFTPAHSIMTQPTPLTGLRLRASPKTSPRSERAPSISGSSHASLRSEGSGQGLSSSAVMRSSAARKGARPGSPAAVMQALKQVTNPAMTEYTRTVAALASPAPVPPVAAADSVPYGSPARSQASSQLSEIADSLQQAEQDFDEDIRPSCLFSGGQDEGSYSSSPKDSPRAAEHSFGPHGPSPLAPTSAILRRFAGNADPASGADMDGGNADIQNFLAGATSVAATHPPEQLQTSGTSISKAGEGHAADAVPHPNISLADWNFKSHGNAENVDPSGSQDDASSEASCASG